MATSTGLNWKHSSSKLKATKGSDPTRSDPTQGQTRSPKPAATAVMRTTKIRKYSRSTAFDDNRKLAHYAKLSSRHAIDELLEAGISVVYLKDGKLVRKGPDNTLTVVKEL